MQELERRKAAVVERWYFARTKAEATPLVHVGFDLLPPVPLTASELQAAVGNALHSLPELHPFLSSRVLFHDGSQELELVRVQDTFSTSDVLGVSTEPVFEHALDEQLRTTFDLDGRLWGAWLHLPPSSLSPEVKYTRAYAAVYIHHALADGVAVCGVARTLVLLLNDPALSLPTPQGGLPLPLDARVNIKPSLSALGSAVFTAYVHPRLPALLTSLYEPRTTPWTGAALMPPLPRRSLHKIVQLPPAQLSQLLHLGRKNGVTFTALLHTLMWSAVSPLVNAETQHLYTSVPASLLPLMYPSPSQPAPVGGCYVSPIHYHGPPSPPSETLDEFLARCKVYAKHLKDPSVLVSGVQAWGLVGMLSYEGIIRYLRKRFVSGEGRNSYSISNLRNVAFSAEQVRGGWIPERAVFTQPMLGSSATLLADVVSVSVEGREGEGQGCTVVFCWEEGVLTEQEAEGIVQRTREGWEWVLREADTQGA
ncbi:hypothetical protein CALVIDRAFT_555275 [Calocera viscosa TUFC12733]|uniref:Alcohol acetyltransferase n=1 Tax=Calocera viscosa (strain TUFC12733) TaxID=1330018 RepID=A0A167LZJ9_CALVF|nr:hypothetical protein CALVIDRAFT_555275 [Calocera viscosa TUFC12733]